MRNKVNIRKTTKNEQLREEIRNRYMKQIFQMRRAQVLPEKVESIFQEANFEVNSSKSQPVNLIIINKLLEIYQSFPHHPDTFILLGNYLLDHPMAERYIIPRILSADEQTKKISEWRWVIALGMSANMEYDGNILDDYDQAVSGLIQISGIGEQLRKSLDLLSVLLNIYNKKSQKYYIPWQCVIRIEKRLPSIKFNQIKQDLKYTLVQVCLFIFDRYFTSIEEQNVSYTLNLDAYMNLFYVALSQFPNFRIQYLLLLQQISLKYSCYIEYLICQTYTGKNILRQLLYLLQQTKKHQRNILKIFKYWVHMFSLQNLVEMLNEALHIYLIEAITLGNLNYEKRSQDTREQDIDFEQSLTSIALKTLKTILDRLKQKQEDRLLNNILVDIENRDFQKWANQFFETRHENDAEEALTELVDDYYSNDVEI